VAAFVERRDYLVPALNALPGVRCAMPGGAFYTFPNITATGFNSRTLQSRLLDEAGVATVSGTSFGAYGEGHLRFSYAASLDALREAVARIGGWLRDQNTGAADRS
jgi:aspartate aminotransferase